MSTPPDTTTPHQLVVINAGTGEPSTTAMLANRAVASTVTAAKERGIEIEARTVDLKLIAADVMNALVSQHVSAELERVSALVGEADALVVATPIYKAGASGLFTSFFQVLDNDLLIGTPVLLAATAGSERHSLVIDDQLRGLFAYLRTVPVATSLFAAPDDWTSNELGRRADRAAAEFVALIAGGVRDAARGEAWSSYQHSYGSAGGTHLDVDLDSDLMRLATGGR